MPARLIMITFQHCQKIIVLIGLVFVFRCQSTVFAGLQKQVWLLNSEYSEARRSYQSKLDSARTPEERTTLKSEAPDKVYAMRFLELGEKGTNSEAGAEALIYAIYADANGPAGKQAAMLLARDHVNDKPLELFFNSSIYPSGTDGETLFRAIAKRSKNPAFRGQAKKILADLLKDSQPAEAAKLYQEVIKDYAGVKSYEDTSKTLSQEANRGLFYVQNLTVGKAAPNFEGQEANGKHIKLSDYTNKVVLVCFCSEFCAPCRKLYPYWHSLVERMSGKPFGLVVISPDSKERILKASEREHFTWPVICDALAPIDSIKDRWYVHGWPNIFLIDASGIIQQHWVGSPGEEVLEQQVQKFVNQASSN